MTGFKWSERHRLSPREEINLPGDGWCVRDAFCSLFGWPPGSPEWAAFIEDVQPQDMESLERHLGLGGFDPDNEPERWGLVLPSGHPGISCWNLRALKIAHVIYEPDLRELRGLPPQYRGYGPELFRLLVDLRQPPR
jgi:hypothetical protein